MKPADRKEFLSIVIGFAELKGKQLSAPALELYWGAMQDWSIADFRAAANKLLRTCEFMPTPKDFEDLRRAGQPTAGEAWALVREAARTGGSCPDVPAIRNAVAALGGIRAIGLTNTDQMPFLERRFAEHYETMRDAAEIREELPRIASQGRNLNGPQSVAGLLTSPKDIH